MSEELQYFYMNQDDLNRRAEKILKAYENKEKDLKLWDEKLEEGFQKLMQSPSKPEQITEKNLKFDYLFRLLCNLQDLPKQVSLNDSREFNYWFLSSNVGKDLDLDNLSYINVLQYTCDPLKYGEDLLPFLNGYEEKFAGQLLADDGSTGAESLINSWNMVTLLAPRLSKSSKQNSKVQANIFWNDLTNDDSDLALLESFVNMMKSLNGYADIKKDLIHSLMISQVERFGYQGEKSITYFLNHTTKLKELFNRLLYKEGVELLEEGELEEQVYLAARRESKQTAQESYIEFANALFKRLN